MTESISFIKMQANLSMKGQLSSGMLAYMAKKPTKEDMEEGERIRYLREDVLGLTQDEFAEKLGVTRGAVGNWELGKGIGGKNEKLICRRFKVSFEWLATGIGPRPEPGELNPDRTYFKDEDDNTSAFVEEAAIENYQPKIDGAIPELDVGLGGGQGIVGEMINVPIGEESASGHKVTAEWVLPDAFMVAEAKVSKSTTFVFPIVGDSMFPNYIHGDRVLVDMSQNQCTQDSVFAISDGFSPPQIKRLQRIMFTRPERVRIISDNPAYPPDEQMLTSVHIIGRVCGIIARR